MNSRLTAAQLDQLGSAVRTSTGLVFPRSRRPLLERAAQEAMRESGVADPEEFVRLACGDERRRYRVAALATVGETYLFRYGEQLDALRRQAIEPLVAARRHETRPTLRVWSAGCSGGEEAYTLAILLAETIGDLARWDIRVVGTDLNHDAIVRARRAAYGRWSMRGSWADHTRWLKPAGEGVSIAPEIKRLVTFEEHNLATLPALPHALRGGPIDLIVCRNVMIYLDRTAIARMVDGFHRSLANGGWLVVAPVETSINGLRERFEVQASPGGTLYRRQGGDRAAEAPVRRPTPVASFRRPAVAARPGTSVGVMLLGRSDPSPPRGVEALLAAVRSLADAGRLPEARGQCLELLRRFPMSVEGHLLLASIAEAQDDLDVASGSLRRTLYLDPGNASAHFRLGLLEWRRGGTKRASARLRRAMHLVEGFGADEPLDDLHQLTAARLRSVAGALIV